jgi:hypothetical protein
MFRIILILPFHVNIQRERLRKKDEGKINISKTLRDMLEHDSFGFIFAETIEKESGFLPFYRVIGYPTTQPPNRFANQKLLRKLELRLPATSLIRIAPELDFYEAVFEHQDTRL